MTVDKPRLGAETSYPERYAPELLVAIPRAEGRRELNLPATLYGADHWTAWELSWLDPAGKPHVAIGEISVDAGSSHIIESKSLKLYLNSLNQASFADRRALASAIERDLGEAFGAPVEVTLFSIDAYRDKGMAREEGVLLDELDVACQHYGGPEPALLAADKQASVVEETLCSHLLKSNCPVTGQPDWASVSIRYRGAPIDRPGLLQYLVSFRQHQDFHEHCVERIFADILTRCRPERLSVEARYTRRGGLDINPRRSTEPGGKPSPRTARQ